MFTKIKLIAIGLVLLAFGVQAWMLKGTRADLVLSNKDKVAAISANRALAEWGTEQIAELERVSQTLYTHRIESAKAAKAGKATIEELAHVPANECFDEPMPAAAIDSLRRAALAYRALTTGYTGPASASAPSQRATYPPF